MALTTLQYWQQQQTLYQQAQVAAQGDLTAAQAAQQAAGTQLAADLKTLDQVTAAIAQKRALLAVTTIPSEANALIADITNDLIRQRGLQGTVLADRGARDTAQTNLAVATATQTRLQAKLADLKAKIAQATAADAQRQTLRQAVTASPLNTLKADATAFDASATVTTHAPAGLAKNFPQQIIDIAAARYTRRTQRLAQLRAARDLAQVALGNELHADGGLQGVVSRTLSDFQRDQHRLAEYVASAAGRFDKARATMQTLAAIGLDPTPGLTGILTRAQHDQLVLPANATPAAAATGLTDALVLTAQADIAQAMTDETNAAHLAAAQWTAQQNAAQKTQAAGQAAAIAADPAATPAEIAAAQTAATDAFNARSAADQAAADATATLSATAATAAIAAAAAAPKAMSIGLCLDAVDQARDDLDAQILTQIAADVDQVGSDATIAAKRNAIATALAQYNAALTVYAAANKRDLDQWEAIIPDPAWKVLLDYEEGRAALEQLQQIDPAALAQAMDAAEAAYTAALADAEKAQRRIDTLGDAIGLRQQRLAAAQGAISAELPSAIRGDTY